MNETRLIFFNRQGAPIAEADHPLVDRTWALNRAGLAKFKLTRSDTAFDKDVVRPGNLVLAEHDRAGAWVGVIWPDPSCFQWGTEGVTVFVPGAESILKRRRSTYQGRATLGTALRHMLGEANATEDTLLRAGNEVEEFGGIHAFDNRPAKLISKVLDEWTRSGLCDWGIEPVYDELAGQLTLQVNLAERRGRVWDYALEQGKNIEGPSGMVMAEQGEILNDVLAVGAGPSPGSTPTFGPAVDTVSKSQYGLSEGIAPGGDGTERGVLAKKRQPRRTFRVTAVEQDADDHTFSYLGLGDTVRLIMPSIDWNGVDTQVRTLSKQLDDSSAPGRLKLVVDEVVS